ncbi:hypothetical protein ACN09X_09060 [Aliarcobacter butzleri]|uniref:hypothetical protein n=1 Tax=Aliarcobacter butzleri TaxID=28197 RepID=UPI0021B2465D|nr:hypothetical protein [Aliarcobacter butzleri]MCT7628394.1 hypothetical protein [Aliarcobacter butzleri]
MFQSNYYSVNENLTAEETLFDFINIVKNKLEIFGKDLSFNSNIWDITETNPGKQNTKQRIVFSNLKTSKEVTKVTLENIVPMEEPFLSFAKAYLRYKQGMEPIKSFTPLISSMRVLEQALIEMTQTANPLNITTDVLNRAIEISKQNFTDAVVYRQGAFLQKVVEFISEKRISKMPIDWKNTAQRPNDSQRVGKKADDRRNEKMPSKRALEVLPEIFFKANEPKDILITSIIAILFGAPNRIGEVLLLQEYCEVIQKGSDGKEQYGLRWYPEKGAEPMVKWIIPSMVDTVKKAINQIRELTKEARKVAKWYEENPNDLYLPKELEYMREKTFLTKKDTSLILFGKELRGIVTVYKSYKIPYEVVKKNAIVSFKALEKAIVKSLPKDFPYINKEKKFTYSETLLIQRLYEYNYQKSTILPLINGFSIGFINNALGSGEFKSSIFEKFGFKEPNGDSIKVTTHQFRHYLNTLAQKGGASQLDIAKWSGRKEVSQNSAYDHVSADEMLLLVQDAVGNENMLLGQLGNIEGIKKKVVISRDEYAQLKVRTAHKTDFGVCIHDFSMMPCQLHMDCLNCTEQICIKGDKNSNEKIRQRKVEVQESLEIAKKAQEEGHVGAYRWIKHQSIELEKLTQLCDIFDNENVKDGTLIQISDAPSISQNEQAQIRHKETIGQAYIELDEMRALLEDLGEDF